MLKQGFREEEKRAREGRRKKAMFEVSAGKNRKIRFAGYVHQKEYAT